MVKRLSSNSSKKVRLSTIRTRIPGGASIIRYFKRKSRKSQAKVDKPKK